MKSGLGSDAVLRISAVLTQIMDDFPAQQFQYDALFGLDDLELKQRVTHLITVLANYLPKDFDQAAEILLQVKLYWNWGDDNDALSRFAAWPLIDYSAVYGLKQPDIALAVLKELTALYSAEFAIRPFIEQHFELTHRTLLDWTNDSNEHIRRLASEGLRPRLPWGKRLVKLCQNPDPILPVLQQLKDDPSLYVRKSVANNLNDITKDNPDWVILLCQQWNKNASSDRQWLIRHALRSLIKQGRSEVFHLLGYSSKIQLKISSFELKNTPVQLGGNLQFELSLLSSIQQSQKLIIDYKIHHVKANGTTTHKVFKWKAMTLSGQQQLALSKQHPFKRITTRKYYPGEHRVEILINGQCIASQTFELID